MDYTVDTNAKIQLQISGGGAGCTDLINPGDNPGRTLNPAERVRRDTDINSSNSGLFFVREGLSAPYVITAPFHNHLAANQDLRRVMTIHRHA